jgi:hypothetical protein
MRTLDSLVPFVHVADIRRSIAFYEKLGFTVRNSYRPEEHDGELTWVWIRSGQADLMLGLAEEPVLASQQAILFYMYVKEDIEGIRSQLIELGESPGPIEHPFYLPRGEFRLTDPDGYIVMVAEDGH